MRNTVNFFFLLLVATTCYAQQPKYTAFTVNDGLPSNNVYRCIEDDKGFLWVATDAGIARFDGKRFQVFTIKDGLPDNEVLAVVKEKNGRIWVNCFKQKPAYFDEIKNRFINASGNTCLAKVQEGTGVMFFFPLKNGGIMFANEKGSFIFRDNKLSVDSLVQKNDGFLIKENSDGSRLIHGFSAATLGSSKTWQSKIYQAKGDKFTDSLALRTNKLNDYFVPGLNEEKLYLFNGLTGQCFIYSNFGTKPLRIKADSIQLAEPFNNFEFTPLYFYLLGASGKVYLFNKITLKKEVVISGNYLPNSIYKDSKGDVWVSTIDKGLLVYKKNQFLTVKMPSGFSRTDFLSIARMRNGTLLAGNFYGQVIEANNNNGVKINTVAQKKGLVARERKILFSQNKIFTFSESGIYANYHKDLKAYGKTAINYNDSIILIGQSYGIKKLNTVTNKFSNLNALQKRVTSMAKSADGMVYFGSTDGLYKYNYNDNKTTAVTAHNAVLRERIAGICTTTDSLVWVATSGSGIVVLKNDKVLLQISEPEGLINNASRTIARGKQRQIWVGTAGGISILRYALNNNKITFAIQNLTVNDGLTSNVINEMVCDNDTVFAATGNGITVIPANVNVPKFNIPVQLTHIRINQRDTIISTRYELAHNQQSIQMEFAGIELGGHFRNLLYTLDGNGKWINLNENTLTIELSSGNHTVQIRAVDVNGNTSNKILTIRFNIAVPFWKSIWFWLALALVIQLTIIYLINRRQRRKKEAKLAREIAGVQTAALEQQAFTSLMNPHFMFNALNSIQHYINVQDRQNANRYLSDFASLIRKNFEAAQQSFIPLEQEIENIKIYLRLEQMRFNERFLYQIITDEVVDAEDWMIPTMIMQPLLENALLHGIMPSAIPGKITIELKEQGKNLIITITDNGIGVANSLALKTAESRHKSSGVELIKKRINALSRFGEYAITISTSIAFPAEKNPGNKIILFIPRDLYQAWLQAQRQ